MSLTALHAKARKRPEPLDLVSSGGLELAIPYLNVHYIVPVDPMHCSVCEKLRPSESVVSAVSIHGLPCPACISVRICSLSTLVENALHVMVHYLCRPYFATLAETALAVLSDLSFGINVQVPTIWLCNVLGANL